MKNNGAECDADCVAELRRNAHFTTVSLAAVIFCSATLIDFPSMGGSKSYFKRYLELLKPFAN